MTLVVLKTWCFLQGPKQACHAGWPPAVEDLKLQSAWPGVKKRTKKKYIMEDSPETRETQFCRSLKNHDHDLVFVDRQIIFEKSMI